MITRYKMFITYKVTIRVVLTSVLRLRKLSMTRLLKVGLNVKVEKKTSYFLTFIEVLNHWFFYVSFVLHILMPLNHKSGMVLKKTKKFFRTVRKLRRDLGLNLTFF